MTQDPVAILDQRFRIAIAHALGDPSLDVDPVIKQSANPQFGDFQCNAAMGLAKSRGINPRELAAKIASAVDLQGIALAPEVAGPGFINVRLDLAALNSMLAGMDDAHLGVPQFVSPWGVTIDLCGVNVAKEMHVGHLRATIIGDCLARVFERLGREVHRENHLGDWGVPIAQVLAALRRSNTDLDKLTLAQLSEAYRTAQADGHEEDAKRTLLKLQGGDAELQRDWHKIIDVTMREVFATARVLNVTLGPEHSRGESFFREQLAGVVDAFMRANLAKEDKGAIVVPFADRERPLLIRKSDGGFLYSTTDLAAVRFRVQELKSDRVVYVVDARQRDHFKDVFDAAALIGWDRLPDGTQAKITHLGFGAVLGKDKKPLKTRSGENFTLKALLDEAVDRGTDEVTHRSGDLNAPTHGLPTHELAEIGEAVGIGAVKYADLSSEVTRDYVFDLDRMIAFEGDTGPYIQYAHARISSILAKATDPINAAPFKIAEPAERQLALHLLRYATTVQDAADTLEPSRICAYAYQLANLFHAFYQACPVLKNDDASVRAARLRLCSMTQRVLADALDLLGIKSPTRM